MNNKSPDNKKIIAPDLYRKILFGLELKNIFMTSCSCSINRINLDPNMVIRISDEATFSITEKKEIEVIQKYSLEARNQITKKRCLNIKCEYHIIYDSKEEFTQEFFDVFKKENLPINSWPFFRELVYNITARMYIPPLSLPLIKR